MRGRVAALAAIALVSSTAVAPAQIALTEAQKRRPVAPLVRALTNCVAKQAVGDDLGVTAYRDGTFNAYVVRVIGRCSDFVYDLIQVYDRVYGEGEGMTFLNGAYANDLPRAVLARIKPQLENKVVMLNRSLADKEAREEQARQAEADRQKAQDLVQQAEQRREDAERQARIAEAERKTAEQRAATAQAEAEQKAAAAKAEAVRLQQVEDAKKAETLLIDKAAECSRKQLTALVKSGESAEVLARAVMTICSAEVNTALDAGVSEWKLEKSLPDSAVGEDIYREKLKVDARDSITALAVQAKAGVGGFASTSN